MRNSEGDEKVKRFGELLQIAEREYAALPEWMKKPGMIGSTPLKQGRDAPSLLDSEVIRRYYRHGTVSINHYPAAEV